MTQPKSGAEDGAPDGALAAALSRLVTNDILTPRQARAVTREVRAQVRAGARPERSPWSLLLAELAGYVGAAFVLGAAVILFADNWHHLGTSARVAVLAVPAVLLSAAALLTARTAPGGWRRRPDRDPEPGAGARRRMVSALTTVAAVLAGGAAAVVVDARQVRGDWTAFAFAWTALAVAAAAYALCRSELLHIVLGVGAATAALSTLRVAGWFGERATGWMFVAVGVLWGAATLAAVLAERGLGFGWSGMLVFVGAELLTTVEPRALGYVVLALLVAAGLGGFAWGRSLTLLVIGVATLAVLVPQAVIDVTNGWLGASGALLVAGLSIVGASALGFRLHRTPAIPHPSP